MIEIITGRRRLCKSRSFDAFRLRFEWTGGHGSRVFVAAALAPVRHLSDLWFCRCNLPGEAESLAVP